MASTQGSPEAHDIWNKRPRYSSSPKQTNSHRGNWSTPDVVIPPSTLVKHNGLVHDPNRICDLAVSANKGMEPVSFVMGANVPMLSIRTACRVKEFLKTVGGLTTDKKVAISNLGLGPLHMLGGCTLNRELCQTIVDNFDATSSSTTIHGRSLCINETEFSRVMGVRNGGTPVPLYGSTEDAATKQLLLRLSDHNYEVTTDSLQTFLQDCSEADDIFKVAFALYALSILLCPTTPGTVETWLITPLRQPASIPTWNWASFCCGRLLEGIVSFRYDRAGYMSGCLLFLQLLYFDSFCNIICPIPSSEVPICAWTRTRADNLIERIKYLGGFNCTIVPGMTVSSRDTDSNKNSACVVSGEPSNIFPSYSMLQAVVGEVEAEFSIIVSRLGYLEPRVQIINEKLYAIQNDIAEMRGWSIEYIVSEVMTSLMERELSPRFETGSTDIDFLGELEDPLNQADDEGGHHRIESQSQPQLAVGEPTADEEVRRTDLPASFANDFSTPLHNVQRHKTISQPKVVPKLTRRDLKLLNYLERSDSKSSDISRIHVARYGNAAVPKEEIRSVLQNYPISAKVIDFYVATMYDKHSDSWFFPTNFGERAIEKHPHVRLGVPLSSIIDACELQRFHRRLHRCKKIFIPLRDASIEHWFLLVMNIEEATAEVWDSYPESDTSSGRMEQTTLVMQLLQQVFGNEMTRSSSVYHDFTSFRRTLPTNNPTNKAHIDSGIYIIRHMQYYRQPWFEGFNSEEQRRRTALDVVNHPKNEVINAVRESALGWRRSKSNLVIATNANTNAKTSTQKAGPTVLKTNAHEKVDNGRKCRSYRKRRTRV